MIGEYTLEKLCSEYSKLYSYISNSKIMQKYIEDYKSMIINQDTMIADFMISFN